MTRHGGHQAAVKSTSTGVPDSSTSAAKASSVTVGIGDMRSRVAAAATLDKSTS